MDYKKDWIIKYFPFMGFNIDGSSNVESGDITKIYTNEDALKICLQRINESKNKNKNNY